jgi:hypothetical protein
MSGELVGSAGILGLQAGGGCQLDLARKAGTTGYPPKGWPFVPALVYFDGDSFVPDVGGPAIRAAGAALR